MKNLKTLGLTALVAAAAMNASAVPINITVDAAGNLLNVVGIANNTQYGQQANDPADNLAFLNVMIGNWNGAPATLNPDQLPAAGINVAGNGSLGGASSFDGAGYTGYKYAVVHYGAGQAGGQQVSPGGWYQAWYLGGAELDINALPQVNNKNVGGFSSIQFFGTHIPGGGGGDTPGVPDGGSSLALLGAGLMGLGLVRRRMA